MYIDGLNLYYGGRARFGHQTRGWRWLGLRQLSERLIAGRCDWIARGAILERVVYCSTFIDGRSNEGGRRRQGAYVEALRTKGSFDHFEEGRFVSRVRQGMLATRNERGKPMITEAGWPIRVQDHRGHPVRRARFMVSYLNHEEKGSDVNVATHLLVDVLSERVDAVILVSNDSDLKVPIQVAREKVPVGIVKSKLCSPCRRPPRQTQRRCRKSLVVPTYEERFLLVSATRESWKVPSSIGLVTRFPLMGGNVLH